MAAFTFVLAMGCTLATNDPVPPPTTTSDRPTTTSNRPTTTSNRPTTTSNRPTTTLDEPDEPDEPDTPDSSTKRSVPIRPTFTSPPTSASPKRSSTTQPSKPTTSGPPTGRYTCQQYSPGSGYLPFGAVEIGAGQYTPDLGDGGTFRMDSGGHITFETGNYADNGWDGQYYPQATSGYKTHTIVLDPDDLEIFCHL